MAKPLDGIRVLDFTRYQQGPFATLMLADMGAEVVKVEDPYIGDFGRRMWKEPDGYSGFWHALDRGKQSICIDLKQPGASDLVLDIVPSFDIVCENFRPGTMERWGIGYDQLRQRHPGLIYGQATGWGTRGPKAEEPSFDQIAQAYSGYATHSGGGPGFRPEVSWPGIADQSGAMNFAFGLMTALFVRERTGIGQRVEVSLLGTQLALQATELQHFLHFGWERPREFRAAPTVGHFECSDGRWVMIVGIDQKFWPRICAALDADHLVDDARFARGFPRWKNRAELEPLLEEIFAQRPSAEWLERLREQDVPASLVQSYADIVTDEQARANNYIVEQDHPKFGLQKIIGLHVQLSETPGEPGPPPPELGEHTVEVLLRLGVEQARIDSLLEAGVISEGVRD